MSTLDWSLQQATKTTAQIAAATTIIPLTGQIVWNTDTGKYCIGDGTTALSALTFYGGISASGLTVGTTTITGGTNTKVLYNNNGVVGEYTVTGSGSAVLNTSPTFVTGLTTPLINGTSGTLQIGTTDIVNIGNKATTNQRLVRIGQDTGWADIGSVPTQTSYMGVWLNQSTPSSLNYAISTDSLGGTRINSSSGQSLFLKVADDAKIQLTSSNIVFQLSASAFGAIGIPYTFNIPAHTATTATINTPNFKITGASKQWATGTVANQYWNYLSANTAAFVGASTMTNSYGLYVEAATAGTNATITNNYAAGFGGNVRVVGADSVSLNLFSNSYSKIAIGDINYALASEIYHNRFAGLNISTIAAYPLIFNTTNTERMRINAGGGFTIADANNFTFNTTIGTKLGTATSQKIGFWNATPIVQPTTSVTAATYAAVGGTTVQTNDTFDGYTVGQVVKALRNIGLLA